MDRAGAALTAMSSSQPFPAVPFVIDWGDVPTWISAITTALALIAAFTVVTIELRRDKARRVAEERGRQADGVTAWYENRPGEVGIRGGPTWSVPRWVAVVQNDSPLPIYNVLVTFYVMDSSGKLLTMFVSPRLLLVKPGEELVDPPSNLSDSLTENDGDGDGDRKGQQTQVGVSITFRDTAGIKWVRHHDGRLARIGVHRKRDVLSERLIAQLRDHDDQHSSGS